MSRTALEKAERILLNNCSEVRKVVDALLSQNELDADEFAATMATEGEVP